MVISLTGHAIGGRMIEGHRMTSMGLHLPWAAEIGTLGSGYDIKRYYGEAEE